MRHRRVATQILQADEGFRATPYYCTEGYPTYGHGFVIGKKGDPLPRIKISFLESMNQLDALMIDYDLELQHCNEIKDAYQACTEIRRAVLLSMRHQVGLKGLCKFKKMLESLKNHDWDEAANQCLDSLAAKQAPKRFARNADMLRSGQLDPYYA